MRGGAARDKTSTRSNQHNPPAKGKARAARVSMTPATLEGRPAFVDEQGHYYEAVAVAVSRA